MRKIFRETNTVVGIQVNSKQIQERIDALFNEV